MTSGIESDTIPDIANLSNCVLSGPKITTPNTFQWNDVNLFNASVRYVNETPDPLIGYAKTGDRYAVVLFFNQSLNLIA